MARNADRIDAMERLILELADGGLRVEPRLIARARELAAAIRAERDAREAHRREVDRARQSRHRSRDKDRDSHAPSNVTNDVTSRVTERDGHAESSVTSTPQSRLSEEEERGDLSRKPSGSLEEINPSAAPSGARVSMIVSRQNERDRPGLRRAQLIAEQALEADARGARRRELVDMLARAERRRDDEERDYEDRQRGREAAERLHRELAAFDIETRTLAEARSA